MALTPGTRLGPYEIAGSLGAGGMGEVYKARDSRLDRTVAIKVIPAELNTDADRRARFEREARAVAALSHPHICTLHDIGTQDGTTYLVMEYLAGESLAQRLTRGPLPVAQALELGAQIAGALDAAHKHGIIHRDLKPGNVMLTSGGAGRSDATTAKLLDFGLAKLSAHGERPALVGDATAPTQAAPLTGRGTILGTLQYMAPEQLEGKEADARTDLWALGAILHEMVTGRRVFEGESQMSLIGNIMNAEPAALASLQPLTPPALDRVVRKCLAKHPDDRWDGAHDVADELRWIAQTSGAIAATAVHPPRGRALSMALMIPFALVAAVLGGGVVWLLRPAPPAVSLARLNLDVRPADELNAGGVTTTFTTPGGSRTALTWTPDGQALVFVGRRGGVQQLYLRRLDAAEAHPLAGTERAQAPAVSPDGQWVAFWAGGTIKKAPLTGGPAMNVATGSEVQHPAGLAWDAQAGLVFGGADGRIWAVPAEGGQPKAVTTVGEGEVGHSLPSVLPGGRVLLYTVRKRDQTWGDEEVIAQRLLTGDRKRLLTDAVDARYVPATGHVVFLRRGVLYAVAFDAERLEVRGAPVAVLDGVAQSLTGDYQSDHSGAGQFAIAASGTLAWLPGPVASLQESALVTVDRQGQVAPLPAHVRGYGPMVRVSPDGRRLAVTVRSLMEVGLWLYDLNRTTLTRLPVDGEVSWPTWTPDGRHLVFDWLSGGRWVVASLTADGTQAPQVLVPVPFFAPSSWTPDGLSLAGVGVDDRGLYLITMEKGKAGIQPLWQTQTTRWERWPAFSPDGHWLAYVSNVSGRHEVYVRPYPGPGPAEQVSIQGGSAPTWHPAGRELFFLSARDAAGKLRMMAADFASALPPRIGRPRPLFEFDSRDLRLGCEPVRCYDVAPDGQRFFGVQQRPAPPLPPVTHINIVQNWFEELKAKVPAGGAK